MIFAQGNTTQDTLRSNIVWRWENEAEISRLARQGNIRAQAVEATFKDMNPRNATEGQVDRFNLACAAYREYMADGQVVLIDAPARSDETIRF